MAGATEGDRVGRGVTMSVGETVGLTVGLIEGAADRAVVVGSLIVEPEDGAEVTGEAVGNNVTGDNVGAAGEVTGPVG